MTIQSDAPTLDELQEQMQIIRAEKDAGRKATMRAQFFSDARHYWTWPHEAGSSSLWMISAVK